MSDTPRTDAAFNELTSCNRDCAYNLAEFARQLERELAKYETVCSCGGGYWEMHADNCQKNAAPQPSTAEPEPAPSQEGVGQGAAAVAAPEPIKSIPAEFTIRVPGG